MEEAEGEGAPAVRLGNGATEPSGDSGPGLAPSHSGQYDSTGSANEGDLISFLSKEKTVMLLGIIRQPLSVLRSNLGHLQVLLCTA